MPRRPAGPAHVIAPLSFLLVLVASATEAQDRQRVGLWGGFQIGLGHGSSDRSNSGGVIGAGVNLAYAVADHVSLGVEVNGSAIATSGFSYEGLLTTTATVWIHSQPSLSGLWFKGGIGPAVKDGWSLGLLLGMGVNLRLGQRVVLVPSVMIHAGGPEPYYRMQAVRFGLGLSFL